MPSADGQSQQEIKAGEEVVVVEDEDEEEEEEEGGEERAGEVERDSEFEGDFEKV